MWEFIIDHLGVLSIGGIIGVGLLIGIVQRLSEGKYRGKENNRRMYVRQMSRSCWIWMVAHSSHQSKTHPLKLPIPKMMPVDIKGVLRMMHEMRKSSTAVLIVLNIGIMMTVSGCDVSQTVSSEDIEFLTAAESWYHYDEVTGENEVMSFREDLSFYWGCECGEPIDNSDLLELYEYDKETSVIKLYNGYDDFTMEAEVLDSSDYHLLLKIDGEIKDYTYIDAGLDIEESEKYLSGYSGEFNTLGISDEGVVLGPFNYDGDVDYPEDTFMTCALAEDAKVYLLDIDTYIKDGEVVSHDVDYRPLGDPEAASYLDQGTAFAWFDDDLRITKLLFYGELSVEE